MRTVSCRQWQVPRWLLAGSIGLALAIVGLSTRLVAQTNVMGQWRTLPYLMPINPVHLALLNTGEVLVVAGSGNVATERNFRAAIWNPQANTIVTQSLGWDMFCNGMAVLPDGRVFINGGNLQYDPFLGEPRNAVFDPATHLFIDVENMAHGRWYPTTTVLGDGRVMTFSGLSETGGTNTSVEIYTPGTGWGQEYAAGWTPPLYPRMHLVSDGRVLYSGSGRETRTFNPITHAWSAVFATTNYSGTRRYGTSVLLPLIPSNGYASRVMIFGGGNPATETTEIIDLSQPRPSWQFGPPMSQPRIEMNATILPNGKVLAVGGSRNDQDASTASLNADLYDPTTNTFSPAGANVYPRLYHSGALLLPDATVMLVGGNPARGSYEQHIEIYSPAYLFNANGTPASRPTVTGVSSAQLGYGNSFQVFTPDAANIAAVVLVRPGAPTHAFDMDQRLVGLSHRAGNGVLNVTAPPNGNIAPPGYYMLFVLDSAGVPSVATFVRLANEPPTAMIRSPSSDVTVDPGESVLFGGYGSDFDGSIHAYSWSFPGGLPSSSSEATPGNVVYLNPGTSVASLTVTDNAGASSTTVTRTVTVSRFGLSATPASRSIAPGGGTTYATTVTPFTGFTGTAGFTVSGLPSGATASFSPDSLSTSGSATLSVTTSGTILPGSYPLRITGASGPDTRSVNVTLVIAAGSSLAVTPANQTVAASRSTLYTGTVAGQGFSGVVNFSVSGMPRNATAKFTPSSVTNAGTSTLSVSRKKSVARGTYTLRVTGTSGGHVRSVDVTLIVQ